MQALISFFITNSDYVVFLCLAALVVLANSFLFQHVNNLRPTVFAKTKKNTERKKTRKTLPIQPSWQHQFLATTLGVIWTDFLRQRVKKKLKKAEQVTTLITYIEYLLLWPGQEMRAIFIMKFLGDSIAHQIYGQLSAGAKSSVQYFLCNPLANHPEQRLLIQVGSELIQQLNSESSIFHNPYYNSIILLLKNFSKRTLVDIFLNLPIHLIPRLSLYLNANQMSLIYDQIKKISPSHFYKINRAVQFAEGAQDQDQYDPAIFKLLSKKYSDLSITKNI